MLFICKSLLLQCFNTHITSPYKNAVYNVQTSLFYLQVKVFVKLSTNKWKHKGNYTFIDMYRHTGTDSLCFTESNKNY